MPVVATTSSSGGVTTTVYRVDIPVSKVKLAPRSRVAPLAGTTLIPGPQTQITAAHKFSVYKDFLTPNSTPSGFYVWNVDMSPADYLYSPINIRKSVTIINGVGVATGAYRIATFGENPFELTGSSINANVYHIDVPSQITYFNGCQPFCVEADCGYPFGTIRLVYDNIGVRISSSTPPGAWVRNQEVRGSSGVEASYNNQVTALGSQLFSRMWLGVTAFDFEGRQAGYIDSTLPTFKLAYPAPIVSSTLYGWNYQTNAVYRSNVTLTGQWKAVDHSADPMTYYPLPGVNLGSSFAIPFTDTNPTGQQPQLKPDFNFTLPAPALPANKYTGVMLKVSATSDYISIGGVTFTSLDSGTLSVRSDSGGQTCNNIYLPYSEPPYWPWDVQLRPLGDDDATVRYVRHAGYRPLSANIPPSVPQTSVSPIVTRSGKLVLLQGGNVSGLISAGTLYPTPSTPTCTAANWSTTPADQNKTASARTMRWRVVSREWSAEWWGTGTLFYVAEYTTTAGTTFAGSYRHVYNQYNDGTTRYSGPGIVMTDILSLVNNSIGIAGNVEITTGRITNVSLSSQVRSRGMSDGSASAAARGVIHLVGLPSDQDTLTISDGVLKKTFEFDQNAVWVPTNIRVIVGATIDATQANLMAAINSSGLAITASVAVPTDLVAEITLCQRRMQSGGEQFSSDQWIAAVP